MQPPLSGEPEPARDKLGGTGARRFVNRREAGERRTAEVLTRHRSAAVG